VKDKGLRSLIRKKGHRILELGYNPYADKKVGELYEEIRNSLNKLACQA